MYTPYRDTKPSHTLSIDIETRSSADIGKYGVYKYVDSDDFKILWFSYSLDHGEVVWLDLTTQELPRKIAVMLDDRAYQKIAFNAQFERVALTKYMRKLGYIGSAAWLNAQEWRDTMVTARELGLPASLKYCAMYLGIEMQKDTRGVSLINFFSKPTKDGSFREPDTDPEKWELFGSYNEQDVRVEQAIADRLVDHSVPESEWQLWALDQAINDRGVRTDLSLAEGAVALMDSVTTEAKAKMRKVTGLDNPNSLKQMKGWLADQGYAMDSLDKAHRAELLARPDLKPAVREVLELKAQTSNSSVKKFEMVENATCNDGRLHGMLQFYGASRTGRWAGRLLQVQNLPRNGMHQLPQARELTKAKDADSIDMIWGSVPDTLKQLIRTVLIPADGHHFTVADFSAIEARVIAWYAHEDWTLEAFRTHGKIYEATASQMFNIPLDQIDKATRQKGKVATLALGYQGSTGALIAMGALSMGLDEDELPDLVTKWRKANKNIVRFWYAVEKAVLQALETGRVTHVGVLKFARRDGWLFIKLPSGRKLAYAHARLGDGKYGARMVYDGQGEHVAFTKLETYGGKLVENIVQATARDLLAYAMTNLEAAGHHVVFHIHDEVIIEEPDAGAGLDEIEGIMTQVPDWAEGLPLNAAGFETSFYTKG